MIFNEIGYQELIATKLQKFSKELHEKYKEINEELSEFTALTDEAKQYAFMIASKKLVMEQVPPHIQEELKNSDKERLEYAQKILDNKITFPSVTEEDLLRLLPTLEEMKEKAIVDLDDIKNNITLKFNG